jgi:hypothetical protein
MVCNGERRGVKNSTSETFWVYNPRDIPILATMA